MLTITKKTKCTYISALTDAIIHARSNVREKIGSAYLRNNWCCLNVYDSNGNTVCDSICANSLNVRFVYNRAKKLISTIPNATRITIDGSFDYAGEFSCSFSQFNNREFLGGIENYGFDLWTKENGFEVTFSNYV